MRLRQPVRTVRTAHCQRMTAGPTLASPTMPADTTLLYVAELVIRRVLAEADATTDLAAALEAAYPFDDSAKGRRIWRDAMIRNAIGPEHLPEEGR